MNIVYCSACGTSLTIKRKPMPKFGRIIDIVDPHVCLDDPIEIDLTPNPVPAYVEEEKKGKFVQKMDELQHEVHIRPISSIGTDTLGDRRSVEHIKSDIKSTAPSNLLGYMKDMSNSTPAHDLGEEPDDS